jgi:hypothetical protein
MPSSAATKNKRFITLTAQNVRPSRFQILPQALRDQERRFSGKSPTLLCLSVFGNAVLSAVVYCAVRNFAPVHLLLYSAGCPYQIILWLETPEFVCLSLGTLYLSGRCLYGAQLHPLGGFTPVFMSHGSLLPIVMTPEAEGREY